MVIVLGAYTRLTDAGLGCPDWPGCYGHLVVPQSEELVNAANAAFPERPVEQEKAWNEMIHRYFASALGLLIVAIAILSWRNRAEQKPIKLPLFLVALVIFQGMLGMWTVTLNLLPVVVMGHLLGGFTVLSCLLLLYLRLTPYRAPTGDAHLGKYATYALVGIAVVVVQIALGGWVSANYAALACTEFPICEGNWSSRLDFAGAFSVPEAQDYEFGAHDYAERMTMHIVHRIGAVITFAYLCWLGLSLYVKASSSLIKGLSLLMLLVLVVQVVLGISNVVFSLPLAVAVMHNAVAACLLLVMVTIAYTLMRKI
ncbi:heme A synthase [Alteromonas sediminis]|uniref:Heme A synthase n=2 Tax=Alteromonas sediminis TaxID=2259342 RepID=A0A3N5Y0Z1_9ALTE|nr:heme A synthase [Alteromonas sediminis]